MTFTVKELREKLANYPDDYNVVIDRHLYDDGEYSHGWNNEFINDIEVNHDDNFHQVELTVYK